MIIEAIAIGSMFYLGYIASVRYELSPQIQNLVMEPLKSTLVSNTLIHPDVSGTSDPLEVHNKLMVQLNEVYKKAGTHYDPYSFDLRTTNINDYYRRPNFINTDV